MPNQISDLTQISDPTKRYDFLFLFDITDGNPNGDPDAGNLPRVDPETMQGLVTDVCIKRKIRNYIALKSHQKDQGTPEAIDFRLEEEGNCYGIFVNDSGVPLNRKLEKAAKDKGAKPDKKKANFDARSEICRRYFDVRMFGGVLSTGDYNCGQVRGPVQITFSRSIDPVVPADVSITRVAITKEGEDKETEMGRKALIHYGLYLGKGFFSPMLAQDTGVTEEDLRLFWEAMLNMFDHDRSASRGHMELRGLYVFRHENPLGNAHAWQLFERVKIQRRTTGPARSFSDYEVRIDDAGLPDGVSLYSWP